MSHDGVVEALMSMLMPEWCCYCALSGKIGATIVMFDISSMKF